MAIHQPDLFENAGMLVTPIGIMTIPQRTQQGVKGKILNITTRIDEIDFFFEDAFLKIEAGKGNIILSFKIRERILQLHGDFSVVLDMNSKKTNRMIHFEKMAFTTEIGEKVNREIIQEAYKTLQTQAQIFILQKIWEKENPKVA